MDMKKLVPESLNESQEFERGQDPKRSMGIGIQPISWDDAVEAYGKSDIGRLINPEDRWGRDDPELDSFFDPQDYNEDTESFTEFHIWGTIDHPMSGYGGSYNTTDMSLEGKVESDGKIHVSGTITKEVGKIRRGEDGDYDGERYGGKKGKPSDLEFTADNMEEVFDQLENYAQ